MKFIEKLDEFFEKKEKKEVIYIFVLTGMVIGFVFYYFIVPPLEKKLSFDVKKNRKIKREIRDQRRENRIIESKIAKLKKEKIPSLQKDAIFYSELANLLDFNKFDEYKWGSLIKDFTSYAKIDGLKVYNISNQIVEVNKTKGILVQKMATVGFIVGGDYKRLISFIYNIENKPEIIKVEKMEMLLDKEISNNLLNESLNFEELKELENRPVYYLEFSIYGYR